MVVSGMVYRKVQPQKNEKPNRNRMLLAMSQENPNLTYEQLGKEFGISKQRAWQLKHKAKKETL